MIYRWFTWNTCKSAPGSIAITLVRRRRGNARTSSVAESRSMKIHSPDYLLFSVFHRYTRSKAELPATLHRWGRRTISFIFDDENVIRDAEISYRCKFQPTVSMTRYPWQKHWVSQIGIIQPFSSFRLLRKSVFNRHLSDLSFKVSDRSFWKNFIFTAISRATQQEAEEERKNVMKFIQRGKSLQNASNKERNGLTATSTRAENARRKIVLFPGRHTRARLVAPVIYDRAVYWKWEYDCYRENVWLVRLKWPDVRV